MAFQTPGYQTIVSTPAAPAFQSEEAPVVEASKAWFPTYPTQIRLTYLPAPTG